MNLDVVILIATAVNTIISITTLFIVTHIRLNNQMDQDLPEEDDPKFLGRNLDSRLRDLQTRRFGVPMDPRPHYRHIDKKEK